MTVAVVKNGIPSVRCNGFGPEGPPCQGCPNDYRCPILRPETRKRLYEERRT